MSPTHHWSRVTDWFVGRGVVVAFLLVAGLVAAATQVRFQPVQVPGYLLLVGSDLIQNPLLPGLSGGAYTAFLAAYLYGVALLVGNGYRLTRRTLGRD